MQDMRSIINIINEASSDDYFRKIEALDNMINDKAATAGEKENAKTLKAKIEQKLKAEFPNAKPSAKAKANPYSADDIYAQHGDWFSDIFRGWDAARAKEAKYNAAKEPGADRGWIKDEIEQLKARRKQVNVGRSLGNVKDNQEYKALSTRIDRLLSTYFPEEWAELERKREKANAKAYDRRAEKNNAKDKTAVDQAKASGNKVWDQIAKENTDGLLALGKFLVGSEMKMTGYGPLPFTMKGKNGKPGARSVLHFLPHIKTTDLRSAFQKLPPDTQQQIRTAMVSAHTIVGRVPDNVMSYTQAQKDKILKGMDIVKQADGMPYDEFEAKYDPILMGYTRKPSRWISSEKPIDDPVAEMGASGNNKASRKYILGWLDKLLSDQQRAEMLADAKVVSVNSPEEENIIFGWKTLLTPEGEVDGITWDQFKEKYKDIIETVKYKRERYEKNESLFDIFGKSATGYDEREYREHIAKLSKEQKAELLAGLAEVSPKNAIEKARIKRLTGYFE